MKHDETSTTTSYSDVHPRETTSIHARATVVTVVVSSQRCDGCDGESRRGTWGLVALTLGNANSSRSQEISPAQIFCFCLLDMRIGHRIEVSSPIAIGCWSRLAGHDNLTDGSPQHWTGPLWLWEFGWVKCSGSRAGFGFLWFVNLQLR